MKLVCICSKSSAGKNEIVNRLKEINPTIQELISETTRPRRNGEAENTYNFISEKEFLYMIENFEFVEHRDYNTKQGIWYYGLAKHTIDYAIENNINSVVILDIQGLKQLKEYLKEIGQEDILKSVYIDCDGKTRMLRSLCREGELNDLQVNEICRRYIDDEVAFADLSDIDIKLNNVKELDLYLCIDEINKIFMED